MKTIYTQNNSMKKAGWLAIVCLLILVLYPRPSMASQSRRWIYNIDLKAAYAENGRVMVEWEVAENEEPQYYALEKSTDGVNYNEVYRVAGKNSDPDNEPVTYQGIDSDISPGLSYYRVGRVDANGNKIYSYSIAFRNEKEESNHFASLTVFPNPFVEHCCVKLNCKEDARVNLMIVGTKGRVYYSTEYYCTQGENVIHLSLGDKMLEGMCFLRVINVKTGDSIFERILKNDH